MMDVLARFALEGKVLSCAPYGSGHINQTFLVETDVPRRYILQKINSTIFKDVPALMRNIDLVTSYLRAQGAGERETLHLVPTVDGKAYLHNANGDYRVYDFIEDSICLDRVQTAEDFMQSAVAFGRFQQQLKNFPADQLSETLPGFHNTVKRVENLRRAIAEDQMGRAKLVQREIDFALDQARYAGVMLDMLSKGDLPLRVTHNDTKLNNVMLDAATRAPLCVIDLDTVMPGFSVTDFGDAIRFGASTAAEDETDLDKVWLDLDKFAAYTKGFLEGCGGLLDEREIMLLPEGAKMMTIECGMRFLEDYLRGDVYFKTAYPEHNLVRARTQFRLLKEMDEHWTEMLACVRELAQKGN